MTNNNANKSKQLILKKKINIVIIKKNLWLSISKDKFNEFIKTGKVKNLEELK